MRTSITTSTLLISIVLIILIHCTIISQNARYTEVSTGLNSSMDYAYDRMFDYYSDEEFLNKYIVLDDSGFAKLVDGKLQFKTNVDTVKTDLIQHFCSVLQERLGSDGKIKVQLLYMDLQEGTFQVRVTEYFPYPLLNKVGTCVYEKTYTLY